MRNRIHMAHPIRLIYEEYLQHLCRAAALAPLPNSADDEPSIQRAAWCWGSSPFVASMLHITVHVRRQNVRLRMSLSLLQLFHFLNCTGRGAAAARPRRSPSLQGDLQHILLFLPLRRSTSALWRQASRCGFPAVAGSRVVTCTGRGAASAWRPPLPGGRPPPAPAAWPDRPRSC